MSVLRRLCIDLMARARAPLSRPPEADLSVTVSRKVAAAEWRWHYSNEQARLAGCPCGGPAQVSRPHAVIGTVPYLWWTCEDHAGATVFSGGLFGPTALYDHPTPCPMGDDWGKSGPIGGPPVAYHCPHRTHQETT